MEYKHLRWLITLIAFSVGVIHLVWPTAAIDGVTAMLLLVAVIPWLQPLFKSIELPGGLKVEFQDLQNVEERAKAVGLLDMPPSTDGHPQYSFLEVASSDPNLALAGLRIELERRLDILARSRGHVAPRGIGTLLRFLNEVQLINGYERAVLSDLAALLNSAVHGARVDSEAAQWALDIGPQILQALEDRTSSQDVTYQGIVSTGNEF